MSLESLLSDANRCKTKSERSELGFICIWTPQCWMTEWNEVNPVVPTKKPLHFVGALLLHKFIDGFCKYQGSLTN
jgi:hypothetical protein